MTWRSALPCGFLFAMGSISFATRAAGAPAPLPATAPPPEAAPLMRPPGSMQRGSAPFAPGWDLATPGPRDICCYAIAYDAARARVVLHGGLSGASGRRGETWEYDGASWSLVAGSGGPGPRYTHAMTFDATRGKSLMFGGYGDDFLSEVWEYDGTAWSPGPTAPPSLEARSYTALAFDSLRSRAVLFGGEKTNGFFDDTWECDGTAWIPVATPSSPPRRAAHAMAFDQGRGVVVLFGGRTGPVMSDTWEYDGSDWTEGPVAPASLYGRAWMGMAYDPGLARTVMFGGGNFFTDVYRNDTWEYDGLAWSPGPAAPPQLEPRAYLGMVHDASRRVDVIVGGWDNRTPAFDDTWEYADAARRVDHLEGRGFGAPNPNEVVLHVGSGAPAGVAFFPYAAGAWGTSVASGDTDAAGLDEVLTGPGPGQTLGPHVRGFREDGTPIARIGYYAYGTLRFGANVASGDVDTDPSDEILTGAGPGSIFGPHVRGWNDTGTSVTPLPGCSFFSHATLRYGVNVATSDVDADGAAELLTGPGPGSVFGPLVRGFDHDGASASPIAWVHFFAFAAAGYGVNVAGGDVEGDGVGDVVATLGPGPALAPQFRGFGSRGSAIAGLPGYDVTVATSLFGGRPGVHDMVGESAGELLAGQGPDPAAPSTVRTYAYDGAALQLVPGSFDAFAGSSHGVNVAAGAFGY